jgi:hypothetical protein
MESALPAGDQSRSRHFLIRGTWAVVNATSTPSYGTAPSAIHARMIAICSTVKGIMRPTSNGIGMRAPKHGEGSATL